MDVALVNKGKDTIEVEFTDKSANVLLEPLRERLLADPTVDMAVVDSDHHIYGNKRLFVRVKSGKPQNAIKRALRDLGDNYSEMLKLVERSKETKKA
jgi:DNA-directed RNA polymerase subunit L